MRLLVAVLVLTCSAAAQTTSGMPAALPFGFPMQSYGHTKAVYQDNQHIAASTTATLVDLTAQSGTVTSFQMAVCAGSVAACGGPGSADDAIISIYIDGSSTASFQFDVGVLGCGWSNATKPGTFYHTHAGAGFGFNSDNCEFWFGYPIPFQTEFKATITSNAAMTGGVAFWDMFRYTNDFTSNYRLHGTNVTGASSTSVNLATTAFTFLNLPSGSGWLAGFFLGNYGGTSTADTYLEANFQIFINGEGTASYISSGGEDFFTSGFYFNNQPVATPVFYISEFNANSPNHTITAALDFLAVEGGHRFDNGTVFQWNADATKRALITTSCRPYYLILYYQ